MKKVSSGKGLGDFGEDLRVEGKIEQVFGNGWEKEMKEMKEIKEILELKHYKNKRTYDGNTEKFGISYKDNKLIVKLAKDDRDCSVYSEDVASRFIRELGYDSHKTLLIKTIDKGVVVVLEDFVRKGEVFRSYRSLRECNEENEDSYTYEDIKEKIESCDKIKDKESTLVRFWDIFMLDAVLGNRDRHHGNWGFICKGRECKIGAIYDNGASLFPNVNTKLSEYVKDRKKFLYERCEKFPASLLMVYDKKERRNKRTNYYEYIGNYKQYKEMEIAYNKIKGFGLERVYEVIKNVSSNKLIPVDLRRFYIDIVCVRYMHIIERLNFEESYERLLDVCK